MTMHTCRKMVHSFAPVGLAAAFGLSMMVMAAPAAVADVAVFATNSIFMNDKVVVTGDVLVRDKATGAVLDPGHRCIQFAKH